MSSAGHVFDMIKRLEANKALRNRRHDRTNNVLESYRKKKLHIDFKEGESMDKQTLKRKLLKIRNEKKREHTIYAVLLTGSLIIIAVVVIRWFLNTVFH